MSRFELKAAWRAAAAAQADGDGGGGKAGGGKAGGGKARSGKAGGGKDVGGKDGGEAGGGKDGGDAGGGERGGEGGGEGGDLADVELRLEQLIGFVGASERLVGHVRGVGVLGGDRSGGRLLSQYLLGRHSQYIGNISHETGRKLRVSSLVTGFHVCK